MIVEPWNPAFRGVAVASLMLLIGGPPTLLAVVFPELERRSLDTGRTSRLALSVTGVTVAVAALTGSVLAIGEARPAGIGAFTVWMGSATTGQAWVAFVLAALLVGALTAGRRWLPHRVSRRCWLGAVFVGALAMLLAFCWTRFSMAVEVPAVAIVTKVGHMTGAALWVGGLAVLAALPAFLPRDSDADTASFALAVVRRFSIIAVAGVTVSFATGVVIAAWHVPTLTALTTTPYGLLLSVKVVLVSLAAAIGGFNRFVLHERIALSMNGGGDAAILPGLLTVIEPRIDPKDAVSVLTRSVRIELVVLLVAIVLSVLLTTAVTPSFELLESTVEGSAELFGWRLFVGFAEALQYGAIAIGLAGALALGYELGKSAVSQ